jgi:molecular chaperone DnaJ
VADLYEVLGVPRDADPATIRRAYRRLARRHHPELHGGGSPEDEEAFEVISRAYAVLSDPEARRRYDAGEMPQADFEPPTGYRFGVRFRGVDVEEVLGELFGAEADHRSAGPPGQPQHVRTEVHLRFGEAIRGVTTTLSIQRERPCPGCGGAGAQAGEECPECGGRGRRVVMERVRVRIPPGVGDGDQVRVRGKGNVTRGGEGDLFIALGVGGHSYFRRRGRDIYATVPLTLAEAVLGAEIEIPTVDGMVRVKIPKGTHTGQRFRLKGRGVEVAGHRGDHYYTVRVELPASLDPAAERLIREIPQEDPRRDLPRGL